MIRNVWNELLLHDLLLEGLESKAASTIELLAPGGKSTVISYADLAEQSRQVAAALQHSGLVVGERVLVMMDNSIEIVAALIGISLAGGVSVPVNTATRGASLEYVVQQVGAKRVFLDASYRSIFQQALGTADRPELHVVVGDEADEADLSWSEFLQPEYPFVRVEQNPDDAACILYTSGSTGPPKGVVCSHGMMSHWAHNANEVMDYGPEDRVFVALPIFHANALCCSLNPALRTGASIVISSRFSAASFWGDIRRTRATTVNLLGTMEAILRKRGIGDEDRDHELSRSLVIPAPASQTEFLETFGVAPTTLYGLTDSGVPLGVPAGSEWPDGSCGRPIGAWETLLVDEYDRPVPQGEPGFLLMRPRLPGIMMLGYLDNAAATLKEWRNLWFHTSDRMKVDAQGWYYFAGRSSDSIRRGGENVSAYEVEGVLNRHPLVALAGVVGVHSEIYGEEILAFLEGPSAADLDAIVDFCEANLPYFAVPRFFDLVEALPRTPSEKVDKPRLKAQGRSERTIDRGEIRRASR